MPWSYDSVHRHSRESLSKHLKYLIETDRSRTSQRNNDCQCPGIWVPHAWIHFILTCLVVHNYLSCYCSAVFFHTTNRTCSYQTSCAGGRHNMPPPLQVDLWPFDLESGARVTCDVGYLYADFSHPRPLYSRLRPDVRDRQTDVRRASSLNTPTMGTGA